MPLVFTREPLVECYQEMNDLIRDYYKNTKASDDVPPLNFYWPHYLALEHQDKIVLVTARNGTDLWGFVFYIIADHPQYHGTIMALSNTLAVRPEHRSMGIGRMLMANAEPYLRDYKVERILHGFRATYADEASPLFPKLGYEVHEIYYLKLLAH